MSNKEIRKVYTTEDFFEAMGTDISLKIVSKKKIEKEKEAELKFKVREIFEENENIFSRFREGSELLKINKQLDKKIEVSPMMLEVLLLCEKFHQISKGYFDPRVMEILKKIGYESDFRKNIPSSERRSIDLEKIAEPLSEDLKIFPKEKSVIIKRAIDTTGIVKGYTIDLVSKILLDEGIENFIVDAGGDMFAQGLNQDDAEWRIGIEGLSDESFLLGISGKGIATSGISRKRWQVGEKTFHHLVNPKNPSEFSCDLKTVTVIDKRTVEADGRAKSLFLMGKEVGLKFANDNSIKALFLDYKENVYFSEEIKKNLI
jgi:FAD:protein FMN transferase